MNLNQIMRGEIFIKIKTSITWQNIWKMQNSMTKQKKVIVKLNEEAKGVPLIDNVGLNSKMCSWEKRQMIQKNEKNTTKILSFRNKWS